MRLNNPGIEKKIVDSIRALSIDMIDSAKSGHPGIAMGAAPILYTLYSKHLNFNVNDDKWINRDRFILSAGHGSALLYSILFFSGFGITLDDLKNFRKINSKTPGHPEYGVTPGVDMTTGPLGQGFATAVGIAMAERYYSSIFNNKNYNLIDHYTYVLCSDGDLMEGVSYETASLAGSLKLNKLIVLYDSNNVSLDGNTNVTFTEDVLKRFEALGWHTQFVNDGEKVEEIDKAILKAKVSDKPSIIEIKTIIGRGSIKQGTNAIHGSPLTEEDITQFKDKAGIRNIPFAVSNEAVEEFRKELIDRCNSSYSKWKEQYNIFNSSADEDHKNLYQSISSNNINVDLSKLIEPFVSDMKEEMRVTNGKLINIISNNLPQFIGGSADLSTSTKTIILNSPAFSPNNYNGKNIWFGVREHAMGAVLNGLAICGLRPFGSTFLAFSDYMKPAIRMSALLDVPVTYIFTHDNISIGQDGPTHQPVEQLTMLRSIPNFRVYRPADANELVGCWNTILKEKKPCALVLSRNEARLLPETKAELVNKGAYIVRKEKTRISGIIISTGTEVDLALSIASKLSLNGLDIRVVSMPCVEKFNEQKDDYKESLIPIGYKTVVIEFSSSAGWYKFVYNKKYLITLDEFGISGTKDEVMELNKFDFDSVLNKIDKLFR
jgi:transketolase